MDMPQIYGNDIIVDVVWVPYAQDDQDAMKTLIWRFKGHLMTGVYDSNIYSKRWYVAGIEYSTKELWFAALAPEQKEHVIYNWNEFQ